MESTQKESLAVTGIDGSGIVRYMKKLLLASIVLGLFIASGSAVNASLLIVESDGNVSTNVLGEEDEVKLEIPKKEALEVSTTLADASNNNSQITLSNDNDAVVLSVQADGEEKKLEVTDYKDDVIEIKERPTSAKLAISVTGDTFNINQNGLVATTDYEITVDPKKARILLDAPSGKRFLSVTPHEATQILLRAKTLSTFNKKGSVSIVENSGHDLSYKVNGVRTLNFFDFYYHPVDVTAYVSALTGEIVSVDQPKWLQVLGFLFA